MELTTCPSCKRSPRAGLTPRGLYRLTGYPGCSVCRFADLQGGRAGDVLVVWNALCDNYADADPDEKMQARDLFGYWSPVSVRMFVNRQGGPAVGGASAYIVGTRSGGEDAGDAEDGDPDEDGGVAYLDPAYDDEDEIISPE